jgi:hypothetical protein
MIGSLRIKIEAIRRAQSELCEAAHLCKQKFGRELSDDERELLNDLIRKGDLLEAKVAQFHIEA